MSGCARYVLALSLLAGLLPACTETGPAGPPGPPGGSGSAGSNGSNGDPGPAGVSTGRISGVLTWRASASTPILPASAVTVTDLTITDAVVSTTTDVDGAFTLNDIPAGVHSLKLSGDGFATLQVDNVSVLATKTTTIDRMLVATNAIVITPRAATAPAGFGETATLSATIAGGTEPYTYKWVASAANPTPVTLSSTSDPSPTFTTGSLAAILASGKVVGFAKVTEFDASGNVVYAANPQVGFAGVSTQQLAQMTYSFTLTVTDARGFVRSATVAVPPATLAQGNSIVPTGQIVVANLPGNASAATLTLPEGSTATLREADTPNPWFVPDVTGIYTVAANGKTLEVDASGFGGSSQECTTCHVLLPQFQRDNVLAKFKDWNNSAHGNHFYKLMHYDASGALVWNTDASGKPVPAPTANPTVAWTAPGAMTTYEFGMTGAEGTHYSSSCTNCHTTGANALAANGGYDDVVAASDWRFPNLGTVFTNLTGATSVEVVVDGKIVTETYDQVTPAPNFAVWDTVPEPVKAMAGMQCESCHGPLAHHASGQAGRSDGTYVKPVQELDVAACAVCHDRPSNHDRVALWRQSKHANMEVALDEGAGNGSPRASCNRCHSAQGFVKYLDQLTGKLTKADGTPIPGFYPGNLVDPATSPLADASPTYLKSLGITADRVQPQTCATCHDPHTTKIRIEGDTPMLPAGFKVAGAGTGAVCFVCHNSRNGARNDMLNGVYTNNANPGTPVTVTSIGAPHEADQGDVIAGRNAFFVGPFNPSRHLAVKDTCVGCHMRNFPAGLTGTNTNHTWRIDSTSCKSCHGGVMDPVDGEAMQAQFDAALADVAGALSSIGQATVRTLYYKGSVQTVAIPADATATFVSGRSPGFVLTFSAPIPDPNKATGTITTLGTSSSPAGLGNFYKEAGATTKAFDVLKGTFAKSNWNYQLLAQDGSRGVHNPSFAFAVLSETLIALNNPLLAP